MIKSGCLVCTDEPSLYITMWKLGVMTLTGLGTYHC